MKLNNICEHSNDQGKDEARTVVLHDEDDSSVSGSDINDTSAGLFLLASNKPLPIAARRTIPWPRLFTPSRPFAATAMIRRCGNGGHIVHYEGDDKTDDAYLISSDRGLFVQQQRNRRATLF